MDIFIRFEDANTDRVSERFGPYPFVQLTYEGLRVGPDGDDLAVNQVSGCWALTHRDEEYSDVVIYAESDG